MESAQSLSQLSPGLRVLLGVVIVVQLGLQIAAVIDLLRRQKVTGDRKWVWALAILAGGILGPLVYFGLGRGTASSAQPDQPRSETAAKDVADFLYGKGEK